jgi:hypothetical protein
VGTAGVPEGAAADVGLELLSVDVQPAAAQTMHAQSRKTTPLSGCILDGSSISQALRHTTTNPGPRARAFGRRQRRRARQRSGGRSRTPEPSPCAASPPLRLQQHILVSHVGRVRSRVAVSHLYQGQVHERPVAQESVLKQAPVPISFRRIPFEVHSLPLEQSARCLRSRGRHPLAKPTSRIHLRAVDSDQPHRLLHSSHVGYEGVAINDMYDFGRQPTRVLWRGWLRCLAGRGQAGAPSTPRREAHQGGSDQGTRYWQASMSRQAPRHLPRRLFPTHASPPTAAPGVTEDHSAPRPPALIVTDRTCPRWRTRPL